MSKKSKKLRKPNVPMYTGAVQIADNETVVNSGGNPNRDAIHADYTHVAGDLKRIAVIGGLLMVGLVALSFFIK